MFNTGLILNVPIVCNASNEDCICLMIVNAPFAPPAFPLILTVKDLLLASPNTFFHSLITAGVTFVSLAGCVPNTVVSFAGDLALESVLTCLEEISFSSCSASARSALLCLISFWSICLRDSSSITRPSILAFLAI